MAMDGDKSRIPSRSVRDRPRLKIGRCLAIGRAICCPCTKTASRGSVERHTRYVMLAKVANKDTQTVVSALIKQAKKLPSELYKSLTWDRGKELADHRQFTLTTNIDVYFCDPQSPWQRGSNENTNGLLRQYFPKGTDLSVHSQAHLNKVARQLNERPRETLQFETPAERFNACVASRFSRRQTRKSSMRAYVFRFAPAPEQRTSRSRNAMSECQQRFRSWPRRTSKGCGLEDYARVIE